MKTAVDKFNRGIILYGKGKVDDAMRIWGSILREDSVEVYADIQFFLGYFLNTQGEIEKAIAAYRNVNQKDSEKAYGFAQLYLSKILEQKLDLGVKFAKEGKKDKARKEYDYIQEGDSLEAEKNSLLKILDIEDIKIANSLYRIRNYRNNILKQLRICEGSSNYEKNIAHYTRPSTAFRLLPNTNHQDKNKRDEISKFRLSTIKGVNDPTEGNILYQFLGCNIEPAEQLATFISCFTFNHDSLNQFRLYGKEDNKEVTGLSLVFNGETFFEQNLYKNISVDFPKKIKELKEVKGILAYMHAQAEQAENEKSSRYINRLPLYRCIYVDPESQYLTIAGREEITFYKEKSTADNAENIWKEYKKKSDERREKVFRNLQKLKTDIETISNGGVNGSFKDPINEIINKILLPLRYLIKHAAFKEEQECRMVYISPLSNQKIILDTDSGQMYVEYAPSVKESIHKIYLSQGAEKYKDHFRLLLNDERGDKVKSSKNPFKNKE